MIFLIHHQALTANLAWVDKSDHCIISRIMFPFSKLPVETYWGFLFSLKFFFSFQISSRIRRPEFLLQRGPSNEVLDYSTEYPYLMLLTSIFLVPYTFSHGQDRAHNAAQAY
jgi:hypothetical protein